MEVLTPRQRQAIAFIAKEEGLRDFYLSGGTALSAYYLGHRYSDDLDFFSDQSVDDVYLSDFMGRLARELKAEEVRKERLHDRRLFFLQFPDGELKMEFTEYPFPHLAARTLYDGILVDSLSDLSANKLAAMIDRFDPKDFVDLYFLLQQRSLDEVKRDTEKKFAHQISSLLLGSECMKVQRIVALPRMIKAVTVQQLENFFINQAAELGKEVIE